MFITKALKNSLLDPVESLIQFAFPGRRFQTGFRSSRFGVLARINRAFFFIFLFTQGGLWSHEASQEVSGYWDGHRFHTSISSRWKKRERTVKGPAIFFSVKHMHTYGHAMLDGVFPLYCYLKEHDLLGTPATLVTAVESQYLHHPTVIKMAQFMKDLFHFKDVLFLEKGDYIENVFVHPFVPFKGKKGAKENSYFTFYQACPETFAYMEKLRAFGLCDNVVYRDANSDCKKVRDFAEFVKRECRIDCPMVKNRILIANRSQLRQIRNLDDLIEGLKNQGFDVVVSDFDALPIREQLRETAQAEYLLGTYGSNLTNAIFLQPEASVVVLWHKYAKYFWSRRYCIIHSAFLSEGIRLIEYDKPEYDARDLCTEEIRYPDYFYREEGKNFLKADKSHLEAMVNFPGDAMTEILNVDLYIEPQDLGKVLK